jgi:hypothetical protein
MNLNEIAASLKEEVKIVGWTLLIYGDPRTGKTTLAATIAKVPSIKRVWWFDTENGWQTLLGMIRNGKLSEEEAGKIRVIRVADSPDLPLAYESVYKALSVRGPQKFCEAHGREITTCIKNKGCTQDSPATEYELGKIVNSEEDVIVIDTGSQLGNSVLNYHMLGKSLGTKPELPDYGALSRTLGGLLQYIQGGKQNIIVCAHAIPIEMVGSSTTDIYNPIADGKKDTVQRIYPMMGSQNFSVSCAKYFQSIIYTEIRLGKHTAGSDSMYKSNVLTGSRVDWRIEDEKSADLSLLFERIKENSKKEKGVEVRVKK